MNTISKMEELSSTMKGRRAELIAASAFMANGYIVLEPMAAETFDLLVHKEGSGEYIRVQTKTITKRERDGVEYFVIKGRRNTGKPYTLEETDIFAGVYEGKVYITENRVLSEYWCRADEADTKWLRLDIAKEGE